MRPEKSGDPQMMCGIKRAMEQHSQKTFQERACSPSTVMNVQVVDCEETGFAACERHNCRHGDVDCRFVGRFLTRIDVKLHLSTQLWTVNLHLC